MTEQERDLVSTCYRNHGHNEHVAMLVGLVRRLDVEANIVRKALSGLVERLDVVHNDPRFQGIWTFLMVHGQMYDGPTYKDALDSARAVLIERSEP